MATVFTYLHYKLFQRLESRGTKIQLTQKQQKILLITTLLIAGSTLAYITTRIQPKTPDITHKVTMGKAGTHPDGTTWVAEYLHGRQVLNYTLPPGAVHSWFVSYADTFTCAVPTHNQQFQLQRTPTGNYQIYIPETEATIPINHLADYLQDPTILNRAYPMLQYAINDIRILSKINDTPFGINGIITQIPDPYHTIITGFTINVNEELWAIVLDEHGTVIIVEQIQIT